MIVHYDNDINYCGLSVSLLLRCTTKVIFLVFLHYFTRCFFGSSPVTKYGGLQNGIIREIYLRLGDVLVSGAQGIVQCVIGISYFVSCPL